MFSKKAIRPRAVMQTLMVALLLAPVAAGAQETQDTTRLPAGLRTARAAFQGAYQGLDPAAAGDTFTDSAVVDFQGQLYTGKVAIVETFLPTSIQGLSSVRFGASTFTVSQDQVVENGTYFVVPEGAPEQAGAFRTTWRRQADGSWKISRLEVFAGS
jgi:ketosteroid isomerase-like protein